MLDTPISRLIIWVLFAVNGEKIVPLECNLSYPKVDV